MHWPFNNVYKQAHIKQGNGSKTFLILKPYGIQNKLFRLCCLSAKNVKEVECLINFKTRHEGKGDLKSSVN